MPSRAAISFLLAVLVLTTLLGPGLAPAQEQRRNLAVVVTGARELTGPWLGTTRLEAMREALERELGTLALDVDAGLWLGGAFGFAQVLPLTPAGKLKGLRLTLPMPAGPSDGTARALAAAAKALPAGEHNAIVILGDAWGPAPARAPGHAFVHVAAAGPPKDSAAWQEFCLNSGGAFFAASQPRRLRRALHRAFRLALSRGSLLILAHDADNNALDLVYGLERSGSLAVNHRGRTGSPVQVEPGVYKLSWPKDAGLGPAKPPLRAEADDQGPTTIWAGGTGNLAVKAVNEKGQAVDWMMTVASRADGRVLADHKRAPFTLKVAAGPYGVKSQSPAQQWEVLVPAGGEVDLTAGPMGRLEPSLPGPGGPVRVPYRAIPQDFANRPSMGYTGDPLALLPGRYRLVVEVIPPLVGEVAVPPAGSARPSLGPVGALLLTHPPGLTPRPYQVVDETGRELGRGAAGRPLYVRPGRYGVVFQEGEPAQWVQAEAGKLSLIEPPPEAR